jgi:hypothetical protein
MAKQFLDLTGVTNFFEQLKGLFATKEAVTEVKESTDEYVFSIDYDNTLAFDTKEIITEEDA